MDGQAEKRGFSETLVTDGAKARRVWPWAASDNASLFERFVGSVLVDGL